MSVIIDHEPFQKLKEGVDEIVNTVKTTLGPRGKNVLIDLNKRVFSTRDGVSVAKKIVFKDKLKNMAAMLIREAAAKTNKEAGDGTTTATILAQAIFSEALKDIYSGKTTPLGLKEDIETTVELVVSKLKSISKDVNSYEDVLNVAKISSNNDPVLGKLIADAVYKVGEKGTVLVENGHETKLVLQEGLSIERGLSDTGPAFITNAATITAEYENPYIAIVDDNVDGIEKIMPILEYAKKDGRPLVLCVKKIEDTVLGMLAKNKMEGRLKIAVIRNPGLNDYEIVLDFARAVGAKPINPDFHTIEEFTPDSLGTCGKIIIGFDETTLLQCGGDLQERAAEIKAQIENADGHIEKGRLQDRYNKLTNSIAIVKIHAESDTELTDKKLRIEDAINACKAAMSEGIVEGGGMALAKISNELKPGIVQKALMSPFNTVCENSGEIPEVIMNQIEEHLGYNAKTGEIENLFDAGVIDPVKVTRTALQKAASVAVVLLTTGPCVIQESKDAK